MVTENKEKYLTKYFTEEGSIALHKRLESLASLFVKENKYPIQIRMYGFIECKILSKIHHEGMIEELRQLLGLKEVVLKVK